MRTAFCRLTRCGIALLFLLVATPLLDSCRKGSMSLTCLWFHGAVSSGNLSSAKSTLSFDPAVIGCRDQTGWTPLFIAAFNTKPEDTGAAAARWIGD